MSTPPASPPLLQLRAARAWPDSTQHFELELRAGLCAITGDERSGKTSLMRLISGDVTPCSGQRMGPDGAWLDLNLPGFEQSTPEAVWAQLSPQWPRWKPTLVAELSAATGLSEHAQKKLFMLSTGSRRKVALIALLASGATLTCLDQPYAGLDWPSITVLREFLSDEASCTDRSWVVADYEADPHLPWQQVIAL